MISMYRAIMDSNSNPLRSLPAAQRLQLMFFLSVMWTTIFCAGAGAWFWYGELIVAHVLLALGVFVTGYTFHRASADAERAPATATRRQRPAKDATKR